MQSKNGLKLKEIDKEFENTATYETLGYLLILNKDYDEALKYNTKAYEYNHSNKALIAGGISCVSATGLSTLIKNDSKITKSKITLTTFALTAPLIALGALADSVTNKERQKTADLISK